MCCGYLLIMSIVNSAQNSSLMSSEQLSQMLTCSYSVCLTIVVMTSYNLDIIAGQLWYLLNVVNNDINKELLELASSSTGNFFFKSIQHFDSKNEIFFKGHRHLYPLWKSSIGFKNIHIHLSDIMNTKQY